MSSVAQYVAGWAPGPITATDVLEADRAARLADILATDAPSAGDPLPLSWVWAYFASWPPHASLNEDGHPAGGHFQPPIPGRRRMWAGGSLTLHRPLRVSEPVHRSSSLLEVTPKSGRSGEMVLVRVQHEYLQEGRLCHSEVQDHVYRSGEQTAPPRDWPARPTTRVESEAPWRQDITTDAITLFRLSALTANSHRIHYDKPYAVEVEGYPDLVVHGPLLALHLALLAARNEPGSELTALDYRITAPVFVGDAVSALGWPDGEAGARLEVRSAPDRVHVAATARYRSEA